MSADLPSPGVSAPAASNAVQYTFRWWRDTAYHCIPGNKTVLVIEDDLLRAAFASIRIRPKDTTGNYLFCAEWLGSLAVLLGVDSVMAKSDWDRIQQAVEASRQEELDDH